MIAEISLLLAIKQCAIRIKESESFVLQYLIKRNPRNAGPVDMIEQLEKLDEIELIRVGMKEKPKDEDHEPEIRRRGRPRIEE